MSLLPDSPIDYLQDIQAWLGITLPHIMAARQTARVQARKLAQLLDDNRGIPDDASFVVYGSFAREELAPDSDLDWSLLIDGSVDPSHLQVLHRLRNVIGKSEIVAPGREGVFGNLTFSHELVHKIGGQDDTNRNLTQRILLLLEAKVVGDPQAFERVVQAILARYCEEDSHLYSREKQQFKVPRFLLNDVVRFWRTMAVDYASKRRERNNEGWALRNAKLRMSRKLLFVSGLLMCLRVPLKSVSVSQRDTLERDIEVGPLTAFLSQFVERTPLDIVSEVLRENESEQTARDVLESYDAFLGMLTDSKVRENLKKLPYDEVEASGDFTAIKRIGHRFQQGLERLFFVDNPNLAKLTREYGVF